MFRNYLAAALRNLVRNRLYATINVVGLAVGFAAAVLIAAYVSDEFSYDTWLPGHAQVYRLSGRFYGGAQSTDKALGHVAAWLKEEAPEVQAVARLASTTAGQGLQGAVMRYGDVEAREDAFLWADAAIFDVLPLPVLAGDPKAALERPDGLVLTRRVARKYFGRDTPLGETLLVDGSHPMIVGAVIEDLPENTHLKIAVLGSGLAPFSQMAMSDADPNPRSGAAYTYVRLVSPAALDAFSRRLPEIVGRNIPPSAGSRPGERAAFELLPVALAAIHLSPPGFSAMKPRGDPGTLVAMLLVGLLITAVAAMNFVSLTTARATARAAEVGVRRACGAFRRDLIVQFMGETAFITVLGSGIAIAAGFLLIPWFGEMVGRSLSFARFWKPGAIGEVAVFVLGVAILAGSYPAFVLSAFRPAINLRGKFESGSGSVRRAFVIFQFGVLIALVLTTIVMHRQVAFSVREAVRFDANQVLLIDTPCTGAFKQEVMRLQGVQAASCSGELLAGEERAMTRVRPDGTRLTVDFAFAGPGLFELYGIAPSAGRLLAEGDVDKILINDAAVRLLGYPSAAAAIGTAPLGADPGEVVGVVPDVVMRSVRVAVRPAVYSLGVGRVNALSTLHVKLRGGQIPETLGAIQDLWHRTGERPGPVSWRFFDQYTQTLYLDTVRQGRLVGVLAGVAIFLSALGLFGLSAFTADQRTKEIGVRKALGASRRDILRLLLWQFAKPVLWANIIAWPAAYFIMRRWLEGFAYHIDLQPWMFLAASALALAIAVMTVIGHTLMIARAEPVSALRYE